MVHNARRGLEHQLADDSANADDQLVEAVLAGDDDAFAEIFDRYKLPLTRTVGRFFRERTEVEEFVQQSFTKVYFSLKRYRGGEERSFAAWLSRIAVNVCYDEFRRRQRKGENLFSEMSDEENDFVASVADGKQVTADKSLQAKQLAEKVLAGLDPGDRIAMALVYSEDYSIDEVARAIGISQSNLKSRLFRCRNQIRKRFSHLFR
ncbi:MAG: RNA polymerase sigma factor [Pyrinomonadaceae bacterium]